MDYSWPETGLVLFIRKPTSYFSVTLFSIYRIITKYPQGPWHLGDECVPTAFYLLGGLGKKTFMEVFHGLQIWHWVVFIKVVLGIFGCSCVDFCFLLDLGGNYLFHLRVFKGLHIQPQMQWLTGTPITKVSLVRWRVTFYYYTLWADWIKLNLYIIFFLSGN